ncbi:MAG TPA: nucleotidyltransferase family protein [candidate division Zixibacteria bacterium]|nr:nucleotidyltransferase family protein [candidate division Zixibacteria bacterium]
MKAMVLAAGLGTRLRPLTETVPKALVRVWGRPMIEYPLRLLKHYGIEDIVINLHHGGRQIRDYLGSGARLGLRISYSEEEELLDTGGGLLRARPFLEAGTFVVINTDTIIDVPLADVLRFHREKRAAATLVLRPDPEADRYGSMDLCRDGRICRFLRTRSAACPPATRGVMFTGLQVLEPKVFDFMETLEAGPKFSTTVHLYPRMLAAGEPLYGYCFAGFWQDLGAIERIREVENRLSRGEVRLHYL